MHFYDFVAKFSMKIVFYLPVIKDKPKFVSFLVFVCTNASFIAQIWSFRKCLEMRCHLGSGRIAKDIQSHGSQSKRAKIPIH